MILRYIFIYLSVALEVYNWIFLVYIFLSWLPFDEDTPGFGFVVRFVRALCDPVYGLVMRLLPPLRFGFLDFSPLYVFFILAILQMLLQRVALLV